MATIFRPPLLFSRWRQRPTPVWDVPQRSRALLSPLPPPGAQLCDSATRRPHPQRWDVPQRTRAFLSPIPPPGQQLFLSAPLRIKPVVAWLAPWIRPPSPTAYTLVADQASFAMTGRDASIIKTTVPMAAAFGSYNLAGQAALVRAGGTVNAEDGSYTLLGANASVLVEMNADQAAYALSGQVNQLRHAGRISPLVAGQYMVNGQNAALNYSGAPPAPSSGGSRRGIRRLLSFRGMPFFGRY